MLIKRPILGAGIGNYPVARRQWFGWNLWAHNHYGELFGELGLLGTAAWFWFLTTIFSNIRATRRQLGNGGEHTVWIRAAADAMEISLWVRLLLGMYNHSLTAYYWYLIAGLSVAMLRLASPASVVPLSHPSARRGEVLHGPQKASFD